MAMIGLSAKVLEDAARRNNFAVPKEGLVFFGVRGAVPEDPNNQAFAKQHELRLVDVNYQNMRCTLGQWNRKTNMIAVYPGSTVPSLAMIRSAKSKGGAGANRLMPGRYEHVKGRHKGQRPSSHRAFRQGCFFPVQRNSNDLAFDNLDRIDLGSSKGDFVWDNLHSAYHDDPNGAYSSAGCQVICGLPSSPQRGNARETGPWRSFIDTAYAEFENQDRFVYLLFTGDEIGAIANDDPKNVRQVIRFGSTGGLARRVQKALAEAGELDGEPDGKFGRKSLMALADFQRKKFGPGVVDGACGPNTAAALGITMPPLASAVSDGKLEPDRDEPANEGQDHPDETDFTDDELEAILIKIGIKTPAPTRPPATPAAERAFDHGQFFRAIDKTLFLKPLSERQRGGIRDVVDYWMKMFPKGDPRWLAYILASIYHETGQLMVPVREGFKSTDREAREHVRNLFIRRRIKRDYAMPVNGISYFGRGRVQTTHFDNYRKLSRRFDRNFVDEPELLLDSRIDAEVAVIGHVEGLWTGVNLADFIHGERCDYVGARRIVNGQDRASEIASFAQAFERAVRQAIVTQPAAVTAEVPPPVSPPPADGAPGGEDMNKIDSEIDAKIDRILEALAAMMAKDKPLDGGDDGDTESGGIDEERLKAIQEAVAKLGTGEKALTPVNGALGETLGKLLNGRKSAIGIVGALLTSILGQAGGDSILGKLVVGVTGAVPALGGLSGPLLPIFLAMAAWGILGKQEKWMFAKTKKKP